MPLFEAKAHFSRVVQEVARSGEPVTVTVRGKPSVRIVPVEVADPSQDVWSVRERVIQEYGMPDYQPPDRPEQAPRDPFNDERHP